MSTKSQINRSLLNKTVKDFYVSFFNMPENEGNILGRQIMSMERPPLTFNIYEVAFKGKKQFGNGTIDFQQLTAVFKDDEKSLTTRAIYKQMYRQTGVEKPSFDKSKFTIKVKAYDGGGDIVEEFNLINCFIVSVAHSEQLYADSTDNTISVTFSYDTAEYKFLELDVEESTNYLVDNLGNYIVDQNGDKIIV